MGRPRKTEGGKARSLFVRDDQLRHLDELALEAGLDASDPRLNQTLALSKELLEFPRHLSQHVGGFVITRSRLDEVVPIENAAMDERTVIEWEKNDLESLGLLKVDVLALGMLSCLRRAFDFLNTHYGKTRTLATSAALSLIQAIVPGLSGTGAVFGMQTTVVNPPAAAARAPDSMVSL